jgi:hypothetical protein
MGLVDGLHYNNNTLPFTLGNTNAYPTQWLRYYQVGFW